MIKEKNHCRTIINHKSNHNQYAVTSTSLSALNKAQWEYYKVLARMSASEGIYNYRSVSVCWREAEIYTKI